MSDPHAPDWREIADALADALGKCRTPDADLFVKARAALRRYEEASES